MRHTRIKMLCIVVGMMLLLSTVVYAVSMGGVSLLNIAGDAETGELPDGTALSIAEAIPEEYSPEGLITNTYHKDMLSDLGIDKTGEILDFNFAARSLTAINERYPMECVRRVTDQLIYTVYRMEDEGKEFNAYFFFEKLDSTETVATEGTEVWWLTGRVLFSEKELSFEDFSTISVGSSVEDVMKIDPMTSDFVPEDIGSIAVQDFDFELNDYVERIYTPEPVLEYKDYHLLTDGILCIMYSRSSADDDFVVASMGINPYFEVESNYSRGTVRQEVAPIDFPN